MLNKSDLENDDQDLDLQTQRLYHLMILGRWFVIAILWLTIGILSLWGMRREISLLQEYFTWSAVRYALAYHRLPALGLALCVGMTVGALVWHSRNILCGLPPREKMRLVNHVRRIREQGPSHFLWQWVVKKSNQNIR